MARKYDLMTEIYDRITKVISGNPESWQAFLRSACNNFKLRFDEQLLIYAQRPDATAVLEIERWNGSFGRWVNRGAKGIAVFEDIDRSRQRLMYYFDVSDTHESRYSRPVPIWQMKPKYTEEIIDTLESTFGELENRDTLETAILSAAKNAVMDNLVDYSNDLMEILNDSFLEDTGEDYVRSTYRQLVTNSVAYMMMSRLGIDTGEYFDADDFRSVTEFSTPETLNALGIATSDIAEMGLTEISRTITVLDRKNRIIADKSVSDYNIPKENKTERSFENGENQLHDAGRLSASRPDNAGTAGSNLGQIRSDEKEVPEGKTQDSVLQSSDELQADGSSLGDGAASYGNGGNADKTDGTERGRDREPESGGYDGVGTGNELDPEQGSGDRADGGNLRLDWYDRSNEDKSLPFFGGDETINEILSTTPNLKASKEVIRQFYETHPDNRERTEYIKSIFNNDYTEVILSDGRRCGYKTYENVLHFWEGSYLSRTAQSFYDWGVIAQHFEAMRLLGQLQDTIKPLPSLDGQLTLMLEAEEKSPAFTFSQEIIDAVLTRGSGVSEGKMRIYEQFEKSLSVKENIDFLKDEYGWGGVAPVIIGTGIDEQHDGKGIRISKGIGEDKPNVLLKWNQVEKRIGELIRMDRYLNPKEKERYPEWLERQEERRREQQERNAVREVLSAAPPEKEEAKDEPERYEYHLGDQVYLGASEYEILSFDDERVMLYDTTFPLFNKEVEREEFDRKVRENPLNDHLKVKGLPPEEKVEIDPNTTPIGDEDYYFHRSGMGEFEAIYYNPDATAGGQFVVLHLSYELIAEAKENSSSVSGFYEYLDSEAYTELIDFGTQEFNDYLEAYAEPDSDFIGRSEETMQALVTQAESVLSNDKKRYSIRLLPNEGGITGIWDSKRECFYEENNQILRFAEQDNAISYLSNILKAKGIEQFIPVFTTPLGFAYHVGDTLSSKATEHQDVLMVIGRVNEDEVWYTLPSNPQQEAINVDRNSFERYLDTGYFSVKENTVEVVLATEKAENLLPTEQTVSIIKAENPNAILFYQVGDFFEVYGNDAVYMSDTFALHLVNKTVNGEVVSMCGIPSNQLEVYLNMLNDRGLDVALSTLENDERVTRLVVSQEKLDPTESRPVGRIEYLGSNGEVGESIEYTSEYQLVKDIKDENFYGVPMVVVLYRDKDGKTISQDFLSELDPPVQGFRVEDFPIPENPLLEQAKQLIDEFCREEYEREEGADYSNLGSVEVAYTTTEDDQHEIQAAVNLEAFSISTYVDGKVVRTEQYESLEQLIENGLSALSFDDLVYVSEDELAPFYEKEEPVKPAWEQKRTRVQTFDLHPDIPMSERNTFDLASHEVEEVGKKERFRRNLMAIQLLKKCQSENRFATPEEQEILSKYVGWGGIPEAFDENNPSWGTEYLELSAVLTHEEYESAKDSVLTAFYTPPVVIQGIYKAMEQMGFRDGNILEPSCGIGNFIGMLPQSMQEAKMYGVEIDKISAGIAQQLYQRTSIAAQPYEEANIPDSFFDAVVGNVPFGDIRLTDKRYDKYHFLIHDYFFAKSLDKLRLGGIMALVTSKGTMDKENPAIRKYIAQRADLLGAIRLPNNTFKGNAGTEVVSDILILQKRDRLIDIEPDWVHLDVDENGRKMNSYFVQHPEMVLGEWKTVSGRFGDENTIVPFEGAELSELLNDAISNIHGEITEYEMDEKLTEEDDSIPADPNVRNFSYTICDDKIYYRENSRMTPVEVSATAENRIKGMIGIRDCVRLLLEMQTEDYPDEEIKAEQQHLNILYDDFTKKYGLISSRANVYAFSQDSSFSLLSALEVLDEEGNLEHKADMFYKRTIKPHTPVTSVDTASEALAVSLGEKARVDMEYMCSLSGKTEQEIFEDLKGVIFLNPMHGYGNSAEPKYLMADEYLSGNVREKLTVAKRSAEVYPEDYTVNVEALEKVQPEDLTASEIYVRLGATWLPPEIIEQFMFELLDTPRYNQWNIKVHYSQFTSEWNIEGKSYDRGNVKAYSTYGTTHINAYKIIEETLNLKDVRIFDYIEDDEGKKKAVLNAKETAIAQAKQEQIKQAFQDWVWADPERRERLCKIYNEKFNSVRPREYDGSHITFSGMNPEIELREHQRNAVAHILYGGNTLLAHAVGAGKTYEMVAAAMESKRLGLCNKSLFVVPNHLTEQWAAEFLQLYPAANILVATKKDFETKNRKRFCGRIATGDYDAVIIGHSQFEKIPMSIERQRAILERELNEIVTGIAELKRNRGENFSVKQLQKSKKSIETKLKKLNDQSRKDDIVTFEELGVDRLFIDESHYYKNLFLYTKMRNVGGIAQTEAQKSSDLYMKCRYLDEITGGRGTVFATGTPISNSMVELYTIQRYLQYNTLVKNDLQHFDAWASAFGETVTAVELKPEGTGYRTKTRFSRFFNLPELMAMFKEVADIKTADELALPVPKANYHNVAVKPSEMQKEMVASLAERAEKVRSGMVNASVDNMLKITNDGRKLALDQRMINDMLPDFEGSKVNACVDNIYRIWEENSNKKSAQLVFCDLSTPKGEYEFSVYNDIRKKLTQKGIPADEVRFIHEADTEVKKQELFKKVRKGEVRVLLGSTQKMGAGTNCQDKLIALHDIDCPWRPSDLEQRSGRIIRQGNTNPEVEIFRYVTEGTFDAYLYQLVEGKQKFASQIMTSKSPVRSAEDIDETALSYAEIKMLATGNPYIKEKMDLDIQVQKLRLLKSSFLSEKYALEDKIIKFYPQTIARLKETIEGLERDVQTAKEHPKPTDDRFVGIEVKGVSYSEKADAGKAIIEACKAMTSPDPVPLGRYRGFDLELSFNSFERVYEVKIKGEASRSIALGDDIHGNLTRIDNAIERIPDVLKAKQDDLENTEKQFETAKFEVEKPFSKEEELKTKTARLDELNILLNLDKRENELADDEPDEGNEALGRSSKDRER